MLSVAFQQESINVLKDISYQMSKLVNYKKPRFITTLGDNFYDRGVKSINDPMWDFSWKDIFIDKYKNMQKIKWHATLGNHDYFGGYDSIEAQLTKTTINKIGFYPMKIIIIDKEKVHILFILIRKIYPELYWETQLMIASRQIHETLDYLEFVLERASDMMQNDNCVRSLSNFSNGYYKNYEIMEKRLLPLLLKYKVDVYFCGHEHNFQVLEYKKIKLIVNGAGSYNSEVSSYNHNLNVDTHYVSSSNGFTFHELEDNKFTINFMNSNGIIEYKTEIIK